MKEQLESLNSIQIAFGEGSMNFMNLLLAAVMFGVALGIRPDTFRNVFRQPKSLVTGLILQWCVLPALTFGLAIALNRWITPMIALGMILVASCPGGNISNFMSSYAGGNVELSVSMTAVTTLLAPLITPLNFSLWGNLYFSAVSLTGNVPTLVIPFLAMLREILLLMGIPILAGTLFSRFLPGITKKISRPIQTVSLLVFILVVIVGAAQNMQIILNNLFYVFLIVLVHNACALGAGYAGGCLIKAPVTDRRSLTLEIGIQNSGLGLLLLFNEQIFPRTEWQLGAMMIVTAWWGIWHIVAGLSIASIFRHDRDHTRD